MNMNKNKKYNKKIIWTSTFFIIIFIMASVLFGVYSLMNSHTNNIVVSNINQMAEHDMKNIQQFIETRWRRMDLFREALNERGVQTTENVQRELHIKTGTKKNEHIFLIDEEGRLYTDQFEMCTAEQNDFLRYFESETGEHFVFRYMGTDPSHETPMPHVLYGYNFDGQPLQLNGDGPKFVKMVLLEELSSIQDTILITSFDGHGFSSVIGRKGNYVVTDSEYTGNRPNDSFFDRVKNSKIENCSAEEIIESIQNKEPVRFWCTTAEGVQKFVSVRPLKDYGWSFILSVEKEVFVRQTKEHIIIVTSIILVLLFIMFLLFSVIHIMRRNNKKLYFDASGQVFNKLYYTENLSNTTISALAIIDIDHLKQINDTYGHLVGDWVIRKCAEVLHCDVRNIGLTVRFGGDEFVVLIRDPIEKEDFKSLLSNILTDIRKVRHENNPNLRITFSIGGYYGTDVASKLLQRADLILYRAKQQRDRLLTNLDEDYLIKNENQDEASLKQTKEKILVVDDSNTNCKTLQKLLENEFEIVQVNDGLEALSLLKERAREFSLILLEIVTPKVDGFDVLKTLNQLHLSENLPVIIISDETSPDSLKKAYALGATDYINRPFDAVIVRNRVKNAVKLYDRQKRMALLAANQVYKLETTSHLMVNILSHIVEQRNGENSSHVLNVQFITETLANNLTERTTQYPMTREDIRLLCDASAIHDIGKIEIPEEILNKPGKLTKEEFEIIKQHSKLGAEMLESIPHLQDEPLLKISYEICRWHHERWDGRGYPDGLKGDQIPITAQIVSLADVYDALTSDRVYKKAFSHETAVQMITDGECGQFNPILVECFLAVQDRLKQTIEVNIQNLQKSRYIKSMVDELLSQNELPATNTVMQLLEHEQTKFQFFNSVSGDIQFEQLISPSILVLSKWDAERLRMNSVTINPHQNERYVSILGKENQEKLAELVHQTTQESPVVQYDCKLNFTGKEHCYRIVCLTLWDKYQPNTPVSVVGKIINIHEHYCPENESSEKEPSV